MDGVPKSLNVEYYARIIKEKALLRRLILSSAKIIKRELRAERGRGRYSSTRPRPPSSTWPRSGPNRASFRWPSSTGPTMEHHRTAGRATGGRHGRPYGIPRPRQAHGRLPSPGAGHHRRPAVHGQNRPLLEHLPVCRPQDGFAVGFLLDGNVEGVHRHPHALRRRPDRYQERPHGLHQRPRARAAPPKRGTACPTPESISTKRRP